MSEPGRAPTWSGCHGVRLPSSASLELGSAVGDPLVDATLEVGPVGEAAGEALWRLTLDVEGGAGERIVAEQALWSRPDGSLLVLNNRGGGVAVDPARAAMTVTATDDALMAQLVVTYGMPLLLHEAEALVVHAAAAALDGRVVLVCGERGRGKSSLLVGLVEAGWQAVSEDLCAVDLRGDPVVWPGPPWVRRLHGEPGPPGAAARFRTHDKVGWDIAAAQTTRALPLALIVFLQPPGGERPECRPVARPERVRRLAADAVWLREPEQRGRALFEPVARISGAVTCVELQVPFGASWLDGIPELIGGELG